MTGSIVVSDGKTIKVRRTSSENNNSSSFVMTLDNPSGRQGTNYQVGDEIEIYSDGTSDPTKKIFTGIIEDIDFSGRETKEKMTVKGRDFTARLQDVTVKPVVYTDTETSEIVNDILTNEVSDIGSDNVVVTDTTIPRIAFNHTTAFESFKELAEQSNSMFYVDENKDLNFRRIGTGSETINIGSDNTLNATFKERRDQIFNEIWIYGDRYLDNFEESFTAGSPVGGSVFTLIHKPHNTDVQVESVVQRGGVFGMPPKSGANYLVNFQDRDIIFISGTNLGNSIPSSGDSVDIKYQRSLPVVEVVRDINSQDQYGKRVKRIHDKSIKDPDQALNIALEKLDKSRDLKKEGTVKIKGLFDIQPNDSVHVNLPWHNVSNQNYDVISVDYLFTPKTVNSQEVMTLKLNKRLPDVSDKLVDHENRIKKLEGDDIDESDTITRTESTTGSIGMRTSGLFMQTRSIAGTNIILNSLTFGIIGSATNQGTVAGSIVTSFVLGKDGAGILGTSTLGNINSEFRTVWSGGYPSV